MGTDLSAYGALHRGVAQMVSSARLISARSAVRIRPSLPKTQKNKADAGSTPVRAAEIGAVV